MLERRRALLGQDAHALDEAGAGAGGEALERAAHRVGLLQEQALDRLAVGVGQAHERDAAVALVLGSVDEAGAAELADELARSG